ncbi:MAG TPA: TetR/AcrR family transcriptional regulator [Lysobacter sp.]|nr:TetR/AcrR family transcriptional regulator [Lysobacter sp.]
MPGSKRRGPKGRASPREVARSAIGIADRDGLEAVSMRAVAAVVGLSAMGLYSYFPSKSELVELMVDEVYTELDLSYGSATTWRERLKIVARMNWGLFMRHPWLVSVEGHRPVLGPNVIAKYDFELHALVGTGLSDLQMDLVLAAVLDQVRGAARAKLDATAVAARTGMDDAEWWAVRAPLLADVLGSSHALAQRVGAAAGTAFDAPHDPDRAFGFAIELILDGIGVLLARASPS